LIIKRHRLQNTVNYKSFECQLLTLNTTRIDFTSAVTLANIYRPPSSSAIEFYEELWDTYDVLSDVIETDRFVACGDFGDCLTSVFCDLQAVLDIHGLHQFVMSSTRSTTNVCNMLDHVIAQLDTVISAVQLSHGASDHNIITWMLSTRMKPERQLIS